MVVIAPSISARRIQTFYDNFKITDTRLVPYSVLQIIVMASTTYPVATIILSSVNLCLYNKCPQVQIKSNATIMIVNQSASYSVEWFFYGFKMYHKQIAPKNNVCIDHNTMKYSHQIRSVLLNAYGLLNNESDAMKNIFG